MGEQRFETHPQRDRWLRSRGPRLSAASLIMIGLILGFAAALYYAWLVEPVVFTESSPARLSEGQKAQYILLVSQSYEASGNWEKAQERLEALNDPEVDRTVEALLEQFLRSGESAAAMKSLATLAGRLGVNSPAVAVFAPQPTATPAAVQSAPTADNSTPVISQTQTPTSTPLPTLTPTPAPSPTAVPVYRLLRQEQICQRDEPAPRIEVVAIDPFLEPLPGVEVIVQWDGGSDHFYTGYQPEKGLGYGDFDMASGEEYQVLMADGSLIVTGLQIIECDEDFGGLAGGWRLTFQNTDVVQESP
jgi:hypothetical protein